jgi:Tfp pilus assembly protein PilF
MALSRTFSFLVLLAALAVCTNAAAQHLTYAEWQERSAKDLRLLPRYGNKDKTAEQVLADTVLVQRVKESEPDRRKASDRLAGMGMGLLAGGDMVSAMYRFNHAFLLDQHNPMVFNGYGAFFMALDRTTEAGQQYLEGLTYDSTNVQLLNGLATAFIAEQYAQRPTDATRADQSTKAALELLQRALNSDPRHADSAYKRSVCHLLLKECPAAWEWYRKYLELGGATASSSYRQQLETACPPTKGR